MNSEECHDVKKNHMISIIIPVYNVVQYLNRCIKSLIEQSYTNLELIFIDDGSTDGSGDVCDQWKKKDSRIVVIHQDNKGVSAARNAGLRVAKGSYIGFVDPDDYIDRDMYCSLYNKITQNKADIASCAWENEYENGTSSMVSGTIDNTINAEDAIAYELLHKKYVTWNKLFSVDVCADVYYDESVIQGEDRLYDVMVHLNASRVVYINRPYYHYCHRSNSAGSKKFTHEDLSLIVACKKMKKLLEGKSARLDKIVNAQMQKAYVQLIESMKYDVEKFREDGNYCVRELRKEVLSLITNPYHDLFFKVKVFLICISPVLAREVIKKKNIFFSKS